VKVLLHILLCDVFSQALYAAVCRAFCHCGTNTCLILICLPQCSS